MSLLTNLISYWKLDGNANDSHGSNNGIISGASYTSSGKINGCYDFDGSDYIYVTSNSSMNIGGDFTASCWVYLTSYGTIGWTGIMGKLSTRDYYEFAVRYCTSLDLIAVGARDDTTLTYGTTTRVSTNLPLNQWNHIVARRKVGDTFDLHINNIKIAQERTTSEIVNIGNTGGNFNMMSFGYLYNSPGKIDEVALWDRCLSTDEIEELYN